MIRLSKTPQSTKIILKTCSFTHTYKLLDVVNLSLNQTLNKVYRLNPVKNILLY